MPALVSCLTEACQAQLMGRNQEFIHNDTEFPSLAIVPCHQRKATSLCFQQSGGKQNTIFQTWYFQIFSVYHTRSHTRSTAGLGVDQQGTSYFICFLPHSLVDAGPLGFPPKQRLNHCRNPGNTHGHTSCPSYPVPGPG